MLVIVSVFVAAFALSDSPHPHVDQEVKFSRDQVVMDGDHVEDSEWIFSAPKKDGRKFKDSPVDVNVDVEDVEDEAKAMAKDAEDIADKFADLDVDKLGEKADEVAKEVEKMAKDIDNVEDLIDRINEEVDKNETLSQIRDDTTSLVTASERPLAHGTVECDYGSVFVAGGVHSCYANASNQLECLVRCTDPSYNWVGSIGCTGASLSNTAMCLSSPDVAQWIYATYAKYFKDGEEYNATVLQHMEGFLKLAEYVELSEFILAQLMQGATVKEVEELYGEQRRTLRDSLMTKEVLGDHYDAVMGLMAPFVAEVEDYVTNNAHKDELCLVSDPPPTVARGSVSSLCQAGAPLATWDYVTCSVDCDFLEDVPRHLQCKNGIVLEHHCPSEESAKQIVEDALHSFELPDSVKTKVSGSVTASLAAVSALISVHLGAFVLF